MTTMQHLKKAYEGSYYTVEGCGGDLMTWRRGYQKYIKENVDKNFNIDEEDLFFYTGADMNKWLGLTGNNAYPDDLVCMTFSYNTVQNIGGLAMFKLKMADRWMDDIVENNLRREGKTYEDILVDSQ